MTGKRITSSDLSEAMRLAAQLCASTNQPIVICGALAMAVYGYRRETSDVDIVIPVIIGSASGDAIESAARDIGLEVRAKHGFGGLDLRSGDLRIDILTLDRAVAMLIPDAVAEATATGRTAEVFGHVVYVVSLGHLISMKLVAERKKDRADIVELIKVRMELETWSEDKDDVVETVKQHLGWYAAREIGTYAQAARDELRG